MRLRAFGCSFTDGTDLADSENSWPILVARRIGALYINHAEAGIGNLRIAESVLRHARPGDMCVINWTWIDRFDFVDRISEEWKSVLPADETNYSKNYYRYFYSQYRDMLSNLLNAIAVIDFLEQHDIPFMMTTIDDLWFGDILESWHDPTAVKWLQARLDPHVYNFKGKNFLDWAHDNGYPVSSTLHPLEQAHTAAADLMQPIIESILHRA